MHETADSKYTSGATLPLWLASTPPQAYGSLAQHMDCDVVVVGGGIAGLTTAYLLSLEGKSVVVLEDGLIGSGETGRTSAHLSNALDDRYFRLEYLHGAYSAKLLAQSHTAAIQKIFDIATHEGIHCELQRVDGYLFLNPFDDPATLQHELGATRSAGLDTYLVKGVPGIAGEQGPCLVFEEQGQFHPLKYLIGLADAVVRAGGKIFTNTHVKSFDHESVMTSLGHQVKAPQIVVATNSPVNNRVLIHTKQAGYRTYVIAALIPHGAIRPALYWDTRDKEGRYHYARVQTLNGSTDLLIVGGEDHKTGQGDEKDEKGAEERYQALEAWARLRFPLMDRVVHRWSGQVMEPVDGVAFIGKNPGLDDNVYVITGDSGNGLTHATLGGMIITDLIMGRVNPWAEVYRPDRISAKASGVFLSENANTFRHYGELLTGGDVKSLDQLAKGDGGVLRDGLNKYVVYRDEEGEVHAFSAFCPHLGGVLHWNGAEKTFDCPCHGSRFSCEGQVVQGPANSDLVEVILARALPIRPYPVDINERQL